MDIQARKLNLIEEFLKISDEKIIEKLEFFIRLEKQRKNNTALEAMTLEEFYAMIDQAKEDQANGRVVSHEALKQRIKSWR
ncbi:MAG: hypothetical protein LAT54_02095 [Cryomorphaceae bacterium]|nr:hypothetical protein [Cryomorphaceae bacterium]